MTCGNQSLAYDPAMTRFIFLTDTHLGARNDAGYRQQPRYVDRLPILLDRLEIWIRAQEKPVAFVLHGGDMVESASPELLQAAAETFRLSVPVYLSLGNHDLTTSDALRRWLSVAPQFFSDGDPVFTLSGEDWRVHVVPSQWCEVPFFWDEVQQPHLLPEHRAWLEAALVAEPGIAHLLCTHAATLGVPPAQTGFDAPYHAPSPDLRNTIVDLVHRYPQIKGVLGGHNHINTHGTIAQTHTITASAFSETPFEFKLIEVSRDRFTMRTLALLPAVRFGVDYRWDKTFVQGRACDRGFGELETES